MRLGRMAIGGLEGDEAARKAVMFETEGEAPIRLTGRDAEQPTFRAQPLAELGDALIKRLVTQPVPAQPREGELVILGKNGRAHVETQVTNAHQFCRLLLAKKNT